MLVITILAFVVVSAGANRPHYAEDYYDVPNYSYSYNVKDAYAGNDFGAQESREGSDTVGSYNVLLPDGRRQIVTYTVRGDEGFVAEVSYEGEAKYEDKYEYVTAAPSYNLPVYAAPYTPAPTYHVPKNHYTPSYNHIPTYIPKYNKAAPRVYHVTVPTAEATTEAATEAATEAQTTEAVTTTEAPATGRPQYKTIVYKRPAAYTPRYHYPAAPVYHQPQPNYYQPTPNYYHRRPNYYHARPRVYNAEETVHAEAKSAHEETVGIPESKEVMITEAEESPAEVIVSETTVIPPVNAAAEQARRRRRLS